MENLQELWIFYFIVKVMIDISVKDVQQHSKPYFEEVFEAAFYLEKMEEWVMAFHKPEQIAELVIEAVQKVRQTLPAMLILGF